MSSPSRLTTTCSTSLCEPTEDVGPGTGQGRSGVRLLRLQALPDNLHAAGLGLRAHPSPGASSLREARDCVEDAYRFVIGARALTRGPAGIPAPDDSPREQVENGTAL
jgi:hypothetical protein